MLAGICIWMLPLVVLATGLLMVSNVRYPHLVNRYLRGRRSLGRLVLVLGGLLLLVVAHRYTLGIATLAYALSGITAWGLARLRPAGPAAGAAVAARCPRRRRQAAPRESI